MTEAWANFFIAQCGASAALLGLLFVSVSLNLARILSFPQLPDRALVVLLLLFAVLVLSSLMLMPGQPIRAIGVEVLAIGAAICGLTSTLGIRSTRRAPAARRAPITRASGCRIARSHRSASMFREGSPPTALRSMSRTTCSRSAGWCPADWRGCR